MADEVPWCCDGHSGSCPLCPQYGTSVTDPCLGHPASDENGKVIDAARLHAEFRHPDFEYATTRGPRKYWDEADRPPAGENADPDYTWERNVDAGRPGQGWDRFDYTEESYWRRPKARPERPVDTSCAVLHTDAQGNAIPCPSSGHTARPVAPVLRPLVRLYEVRTVHGEAYWAEGDVIESGDGWFTLWAGPSELSLRVPEADIRAVRQVDIAELDATAEATQALEEQLKEARTWARHGYEIGQKHCGWTDHGVAPDWLTDGWPEAFDGCEHLLHASVLGEALTRVRNLPTEPEVMNSQQERPDIWRHGYHCGVLAARSAAGPRNEETTNP